MKYADLHFHTHTRSYLWLQPKKSKWKRKGVYNPWRIVASNMKSLRKGGRAGAYGQSDLVKLWNGGIRIAFNGLYPIEKGFFVQPNMPAGGRHRFVREVVRLLSHENSLLRDILQGIYMRIPQPTINRIQSPQYDYWEALKDEYAFVKTRNGRETRNTVHIPGLPRRLFESRRKRQRRFPQYLKATGTYTIPKDKNELQNTLNKGHIVMVLTIEGGHALGSDTAGLQELNRRVDVLKHQFEHPVFFVTFAHHFDNNLCGHAHSLPDLGTWFLNQQPRMNGTFTNKGWGVIRKLLSIDGQNNRKPADGYRILIDVKHMSARSRKQYYRNIVEPCFQKNDVIPVIGSHCGFSGRNLLDDLIANESNEKDDYFDDSNTFNAWNINLCEEDVRMIHKTGGLFGLSFDQRILGVPKISSHGSPNNIQALWTNIKAVLEVIFGDPQYSRKEKLRAWDMLTIGTDYDGYIDPVDDYQTAIRLDNFRDDLHHAIQQDINSGNPPLCVRHFDQHFTMGDAIENLCFRNAERFVLKHYPG